jgi:hypothetical protein
MAQPAIEAACDARRRDKAIRPVSRPGAASVPDRRVMPGREAVEPLAFGLAEGPDGHGGLPRGTLAPGFSQMNGSEETRASRVRRRQTGAFRFSETILGIDPSPAYGYDEFRER